LILDAGVVIKLHEWGLWEQVISKCDVHLSSIVAERESKYHQSEEGDWNRDIDLSTAISDGTISILD
jgi:hypothetical protein